MAAGVNTPERRRGVGGAEAPRRRRHPTPGAGRHLAVGLDARDVGGARSRTRSARSDPSVVLKGSEVTVARRQPGARRLPPARPVARRPRRRRQPSARSASAPTARAAPPRRPACPPASRAACSRRSASAARRRWWRPCTAPRRSSRSPSTAGRCRARSTPRGGPRPPRSVRRRGSARRPRLAGGHLTGVVRRALLELLRRHQPDRRTGRGARALGPDARPRRPGCRPARRACSRSARPAPPSPCPSAGRRAC